MPTRRAARTVTAFAAAGALLTACVSDPQVTEPPAPPAAEPTAPEPAPTPTPTPEDPTSEDPTSEEPTSEVPTSEEPTSEEPTDDSPTSEVPTDEAPPPEGVVPFGEPTTAANGVVVTISEPEDFDPDETAAGGEDFEEHVRFTVTVENPTEEDYEISALWVDVESGGEPGDQVFDVLNELEGSPFEPLPAGESIEFDTGWGVQDPQDLQISVETDYGEDPLVFGAG